MMIPIKISSDSLTNTNLGWTLLELNTGEIDLRIKFRSEVDANHAALRSRSTYWGKLAREIAVA